MDNNFNKKNKFIENLEIKINKQPYYDIDNTTTNINDILKNNYNSKNKSRIELKDNLDPYDYEISYSNKTKKDLKGQEYIYYSPYDQGPGRGFGNLNVNNNIRKSESTRKTTEDFRLFRESEIIDRFDFIDNRYMKSQNVVFPYPRSGDTTRKALSTPKSQNLSNSINDYNFNAPNIDKPDIIEELPNIDIINSIETNNYNQKMNQLRYKQNIAIINGIINNLKQQYGTNLTKEIIAENVKKLNLFDSSNNNQDSINYDIIDTSKSNNYFQPSNNYFQPTNNSLKLNSSSQPSNNSSQLNGSSQPSNNSSQPSNNSSQPSNSSSQLNKSTKLNNSSQLNKSTKVNNSSKLNRSSQPSNNSSQLNMSSQPSNNSSQLNRSSQPSNNSSQLNSSSQLNRSSQPSNNSSQLNSSSQLNRATQPSNNSSQLNSSLNNSSKLNSSSQPSNNSSKLNSSSQLNRTSQSSNNSSQLNKSFQPSNNSSRN